MVNEKAKIFFWKRIVLALMLAPICMLPFGLNEDGHRVFWSMCSLISGIIMLNASRFRPVNRSILQYVVSIAYASLTGLFLIKSYPSNDFSLFWQFMTPFAIITSFLGSMYLNPYKTEKIVPESFLKSLKS